MREEEISIFWFRRDLRLADNAGLYYALKENKAVLPIFIFDKNILDKLEDKNDRRVDFINQVLLHLKKDLQNRGSDLVVFYDEPTLVFESILKERKIHRVYANHDYEPQAIERDERVKKILLEKGVEFKTYKDQCVFEKNEVLKDNGTPYTVFTPYSRKWKEKLTPGHYISYPTEHFFLSFLKINPQPIITLKELGFEKTAIVFNPEIILNTQLIRNYKECRDFPAVNGTSKLSMHLRFGTLSIRKLIRENINLSETWVNELIWRDFYMMILWHFPHVAQRSFKKEYDHIPWLNNETHFQKWCDGKTGFPIVDAGMRELNATGFMHNRVRMIVSSFLVKDLLVDWRWGEAYFAKKLDDFDLSANNGGWQWASGSGCDAAPYFRVFNPSTQQQKFDPDFKYIKRWVSEFGTQGYPEPIINHDLARKRTIEIYKNTLSGFKQQKLFREA